MIQFNKSTKWLVLFLMIASSFLAVDYSNAKDYGPYGPFKDATYALTKKNFAFSYLDAQGQSYVQVRDGLPIGPYLGAAPYPAVSNLQVTDDGAYGFTYSQLDGGKSKIYVNVNGVSTPIYDRSTPRAPKFQLVNKDKWLATTDQLAFIKFDNYKILESACSASADDSCLIHSSGISDNIWGYAYQNYRERAGYIKIYDKYHRHIMSKTYGPYDFDAADGPTKTAISVGKFHWIAYYYKKIPKKKINDNGYVNDYTDYVIVDGQKYGPFPKVHFILAKDNVYIYCYDGSDKISRCNVNGKSFQASAPIVKAMIDGNNWGIQAGNRCIISYSNEFVHTDCAGFNFTESAYTLVKATNASQYTLKKQDFKVEPADANLSVTDRVPVWAAMTNWAYIATPKDPAQSDYCAKIVINGVMTSLGDRFSTCQADLALTSTSYALKTSDSNQGVLIKAALVFYNNQNKYGPSATCGNGKKDILEECEGSNFGVKKCSSYGFYGGGTLKCSANCMADTSSCLKGKS
jgi:hypothetical protein